ncbi:MAG TPA: GlsB/YeaQ/YmgE family stress response membrane protein [Anaerolineales bacterium]|nr:GlsB/YeaQ/YmgE family stress response membrane protein [Anaerolineales bacterium]
MDLQTVLIWIVIGAIAGILAESVVGGRRRAGLGTAILIGILGAFIGGWLFDALGIAIGAGIIGTIITAFIGAVLLLLLVRAVRRY